MGWRTSLSNLEPASPNTASPLPIFFEPYYIISVFFRSVFFLARRRAALRAQGAQGAQGGLRAPRAPGVKQGALRALAWYPRSKEPPKQVLETGWTEFSRTRRAKDAFWLWVPEWSLLGRLISSIPFRTLPESTHIVGLMGYLSGRRMMQNF